MRKPAPSFEQFKGYLFSAIHQKFPDLEINPYSRWTELAGGKDRKEILYNLKRMVEEEYDVELVIAPDLFNLDTILESLASQLHHVYSTVYLMERINDKIRARQH